MGAAEDDRTSSNSRSIRSVSFYPKRWGDKLSYIVSLAFSFVHRFTHSCAASSPAIEKKNP
jgi:hypothetical protein